ncbi:MAG: PAS domain-containing protein [Flavobacteriales bacterium]|nr:PAS domain-containing protein [Flavobacteriales bacterium]
MFTHIEIHILIIDRERSETDRLEQELRDVGFSYQLTTCAATEESMGLLCKKNLHPDIVLCPYSMPETNVLRMLGVARKLGCEAPFILLAYDLAEEIAIELLSAGIEDYINRNTLKRLPVIIRKAIQRHETLVELQRSHSKLKSNELAIRSMVRNMPMEVAMFDREMRYLVVSEEWAATMDMSEDSILGRHMYDLSPHLPDRWREAHQRGLKGETMSNEGEPYQFKGETRWLRWKMNPWFNAEGDVGGLVIFVENITDTLLAEHERKLQTEQLNLAIEAGNIGIWTWECDSFFCSYSQRSAEIYGLQGNYVNMLDVAERIHPDDRQLVTDRLQQSLLGDGHFAVEYRYIRPDGREITIYDQGKAVFGENGRPMRMHGVLLDLTERVEMEHKVRESEQLFRDMAENIAEVFWLTDGEANRFLYVSPQFFRLFGTKEQDLYDNPLAWETNVHPEDRPGIAERFAEQGPLGTYNEEYRIVHPDGRLIWVRDRAFPVLNEQGEVLRIAGICEDITLQKTVQG